MTCRGGSVSTARYAVADYGSSPDDLVVWGTYEGSAFCCSVYADTTAELSLLEVWGSPSTDTISLVYMGDQMSAPARWVADGNSLRAEVVGKHGINTITGSDSTASGYSEYLFGGDDTDTINGGDGDDLICGFGGADDLNGEGGQDVIEGGEGSDTLSGGGGSDQIWGCAYSYGISTNLCGDPALCDALTFDDDVINGGDQADELYGQWGVDTILGGDGQDFIDGGPDGDFLYGEDDADEIHGGDGGDYVEGGDAGDLVRGEGGADVIYGDHPTNVSITGDDQLDGGNWNDEIHGGPGDDALQGGLGSDELYGDGDSDVLCAGLDKFASDWMEGGTGVDRMWVPPSTPSPSGGPQVNLNNSCQASPVWWTGPCALFWWTTLTVRPSECSF